MIFTIERTGGAYGNPEAPCDGATLLRESESAGHTHRVWTIELRSLEDLMALVTMIGEPIIIQHDDDMPELEIYDDYRE